MLNSLCEVFQLATALIFGLFVGGLLAEGALLVPYWRTLAAAEFFALYRVYKPRLYRFFEPLTIMATLLALTTAAACFLTTHPGRWMSLSTLILAVFMVSMYYLYFHQANTAFAAATLSESELALELRRWATWHWGRVILGVLAFATSLFSLKAR